MRAKVNNTDGIFPMPVLMIATYNEDGSVNVMNAAWGSMQSRGHVVLKLTETHKTVENIKARGAFTVSIADAAHMVEADYFGIESGNDVPDKFERSGMTASKAENVDAPIINEFPLCLECEFVEYQGGEYGCGVIGKVVNVTADEKRAGKRRAGHVPGQRHRLRHLHSRLLQGDRTHRRSLPGRSEAEEISKIKALMRGGFFICLYFQCFSFGTTASICARTCSSGHSSVAICFAQKSISCSLLVYLNSPSA